MQRIKCPVCGHETVIETASVPGASPAVNAKADPPPPPEVATWKIERPSPEMLAEARETFDEAEYLAGVREIQETGGGDFHALMEELERRLHEGS